MTRFLMAAVSVTLLGPACTPDRPDAADPLSETATPGAPAEIEGTPYRTVGEVPGDTLQELFGVVTPFLLPDGRLVVPVAEAGVIRVFGPDGAFQRSLGRRGDGPGEFTRLSTAWSRGDTIEAYDQALMRVTRFPPDGAAEVIPVQGPGRLESVPGALPDGWLFVAIAGGAPSGRDRLVYHRFARDGTYLGELAELEGMHRFRTDGLVGPDPLSPMARVAVAGGRVYLAETFTPAVTVVDSGGTRREVTWEAGTSASPEAAFQAILDSADARAASGRSPAIRRQIGAFPVRDRVPAFWDFRVDAEGFLWVQPFVPGKHSMALMGGSRGDGEWWILSSEGARVGSVTVPEGLHPTQITADAVVGVFRDPLGVESVRVHRLLRH